MKRKLILTLVFVMLLPLLGGCWNHRELNQLAIALGLGIDKVGDKYRLSVQVVDPEQVAAKKGGAAAERTPVILYSVTADSVFEAVRKMTIASPRQIYPAHLRILVFGESAARDGIGKILDAISRNWEFRTDFFIIVAKGTTAFDIMDSLTQLEKIPAMKLFSSLRTSDKIWGPTTSVTLDKLVTQLITKGKEPVLTGIQSFGDRSKGGTLENVKRTKPAERLRYGGLAVFKRDKLIGWLNQRDSLGYAYVNDIIRSTPNRVPCSKGRNIMLDVIRSKTKMKGDVVNGKPRIKVMVRQEANVEEVHCKIDLMKPETISELEKKANQHVKALIEHAVKTVQKKYKADIFGFGEEIHRSDPKAWKKLKDNWDAKFAQLPVTVEVDTKIRRLGTVGNPLIKEIK
jgi:spore germination protein KC